MAIYLLTTALMANGAEKPVVTTPLLADTRFERGFTVWSPKPGSHVKQGTIRPHETAAKPIWGLAQWHSRFTLAGAELERMPGGAVRFSDGAKSVTFYPEGSEADIALGLQGILEYEGKASKQGDPWPHLLAERKMSTQPAVAELEALPFFVQYRLVKERVSRPEGFTPHRPIRVLHHRAESQSRVVGFRRLLLVWHTHVRHASTDPQTSHGDGPGLGPQAGDGEVHLQPGWRAVHSTER